MIKFHVMSTRSTEGESVSIGLLERLVEKIEAEEFDYRDEFTDAEKEALIKDGAVVYTLLGTTIAAQEQEFNQRNENSRQKLFAHKDYKDRLENVPSKKIQVAIYPDPERFLIPGSFDKDVVGQEQAVAADTAILRERTGQSKLREIIPGEASTVTEIILQHQSQTGEWLLSPDHINLQGLNNVFTRTKHSMNADGTLVADVGGFIPDDGMCVFSWSSGEGRRDLGVMRMVVPTSPRSIQQAAA